MGNSSHKPDNLDKKLAKRFPYLDELQKIKGRLGPIRILRKSPEEIKKVLEALPKKYFNFEYYEGYGDALQFGYENHLILWIETNIDNLPVFTQTVVYLVKESEVMGFSDSQLLIYKDIATILGRLLDSQVVDLNEELITRIISKAKQEFMRNCNMTTLEDLPEVEEYLNAATKAIKEFNYCWDKALDTIDPQFGYNTTTGDWDIENPREFWNKFAGKDTQMADEEEDKFIAICTIEDIGELIPIRLYVKGDGGMYGYTTNKYELITVDEFLAKKPKKDTRFEDDDESRINKVNDFGTLNDVILSPFEAYEDGKFYTLISGDNLVRLVSYFEQQDTLYMYNGS